MRSSLPRNFGLLTASTLLSLLLAECFLRLFFPQQLAVWHTMRDGLAVHPPGLVTHLAEFGQEVRFNSVGMRDLEHAIEKPQGTKRVLLLGDSFMEALQVKFEDSFPSLLEAELRQKLGQDVEVINCAVSGWGQDDQLAYLRKHALSYGPDLILVAMTAHNDVFDNLRERFHTLVSGKLAEKPVKHMSEVEYRTLQLKGFFASHSHLWQLLRKLKHLREMRTLAANLDKHVTQLIGTTEETSALNKGWKLTFELFKAIRDLGKGDGAETAIMLIPLKLQLQDDSPKNSPAAVTRVSGTEAIIDRPQQTMTAFGRAAQIEIIDLLPVFRQWTVDRRRVDRDASLHLHEGHWNQQGHRLAAQVVANEIAARDLLGTR